jgi:hypothetical protein
MKISEKLDINEGAIMLNKIILTSLLFIIASCSTKPARKYRPDFKVQNSLNQKKTTIKDVVVTSKELAANRDRVTCRAAYFKYVDAKSYNEYLAKAFKSELDTSNNLKSSGEIIKLEITKFNLDSTDAHWIINSTVKWKKREIKVKTKYDFPSSWDAAAACASSADNLYDATVKHISDILEKL